MTKVKILRPIQDKYDRNVIYNPGEEHAFDEARVTDMVARGLVEVVPEAEAEAETEVVPEAEAEQHTAFFPDPDPEVVTSKKSPRKK